MSNANYAKKMRQENIKKIKDQVSLMDLANSFYEIKPHGRLFKLVEHDSCILYPEKNAYRRFSTEFEIENGKSVYKDVFDFLIEFRGMDFNDAYKYLLTFIDPEKPLTPTEIKHKEVRISAQQRTKSLQLQVNEGIDDNYKNVIAYLIKARCIHPKIVYELINKNLIKQQTNQFGHKNLVMLGYDENGMLASAEYKACSTTSSARGCFLDCDYSYCWFYDPETDPSSFTPNINWKKPCIVTEAGVDRMALMSLMLDKQLDPIEYGLDENLTKALETRNFDYRNFNWLSLSSVSHKQAVLTYMDRFGIDKWIIATDHDEAGFKTAESLTTSIENHGGKAYTMFSLDKDWDQDRQNLRENSLENRLQKSMDSVHNKRIYNPHDITKETDISLEK